MKQLFKKLCSWYYARRLPPVGPVEQAALAQLKSRFSEFPVFPTDGIEPSLAEWHRNLNRLSHLVKHGNPRKFLRWEVFQKAMFVAFSSYVDRELELLQALPDWPRWEKLLPEPIFGGPPRYPRYPDSTGNTIHQVTHLATFELMTGARIVDKKCVVEFGGGYGNMCRLFRDAGFRGRYIILDFPVLAAFQKFYLDCNGVNKDLDVHLISEPNQLDDLLDPLPEQTMFLATWSLSETPVAFRNPILARVSGFKHFLIAYQDRFNEVDNIRFFADWHATVPGIWRVKELPYLSKNHYLMGSRNEAN